MADNIFTSDPVTSTATGTHTVYTCPASTRAKVSLFYRGTLANTGTIAFAVNGVTVAAPSAASGAEFFFSSTAALYENTGTTAPDGAAAATTVGVAPEEYFLNPNDTVTYTVGVVALTAMTAAVVGVELTEGT